MLAHNSKSADENCLKWDCERYGLSIPSYLVFGDTHNLYKKLHTNTSKWGVDYLCDVFQIVREYPLRINLNSSSKHQYHGALEDSKTLYHLAVAMVQKSILFKPNNLIYDQIVENFQV